MISITKITISNYRSYKNIENKITYTKRLNLITGKNNSGKTNILRAINTFFNPETYNPKVDMNMIKQITQGAAKHPRIKIDVEDYEIEKDKLVKYAIELDLNKDINERYKVTGSKRPSALSTSKLIETYISKKFKCVYLSTTDEVLSQQAFSIVNDMILQYYKQRNKQVKKTLEEFEEKYKELISTFEGNISELEGDLFKQFELFKQNNIDISPKLIIENNIDIKEFLTKNIKLELDDAYSQIIESKGAGIQRTSLILLSFFLLNEIYKKANKIILIDEPEAFLYPLLISGLKNSIEDTINTTKNSQIFLTSHSREFLTEINNPMYSFYNVEQEMEEKTYARSTKEYDINKYSLVKQFDSKTKYEVLKNYGLLDNIDDHDSVIVCEGKTDRNYIVKILEDKDFRPQIRFEKYADYIQHGEEISVKDLNYSFVPSGAQAVVPILMYLERVSEVSRRVVVLLDGDSEGKKVYNSIKTNEYKNLEITKIMIDDGKEIEDMVYSKQEFYERVIQLSSEIYDKKDFFKPMIDSCGPKDSLIQKTEQFINLYKLEMGIYKLKHLLSINLDNTTINKDWILPQLNEVFY